MKKRDTKESKLIRTLGLNEKEAHLIEQVSTPQPRVTFSEGYINIYLEGDGNEIDLKATLAKMGVKTDNGSFYSPNHSISTYYTLGKVRVITEGIPF